MKRETMHIHGGMYTAAWLALLNPMRYCDGERRSIMTLGFRKLIIIALVGLIALTANFLIIAAWLQEQGIIEIAKHLQAEFLTGTAITIIVALLIIRGRGRTS